MAKDLHLNSFVLFQLKRNIVNLYKRYIVSTEDLKKDHLIFLKKLEDSGVSRDLLNKLDYFTDERYTYMRKKILDSGNEATRDLDKYFDLIKIELNEEALDESNRLRLGELVKASKNTKLSGDGEGNLMVKGKLI